MQKEYVTFYLLGRDEKKLKNDIDIDQIAEQVIEGKGTIYELLHKAATVAVAPLREGRRKRDWLEEYESEIKECGGDGEAAYQHYLDGRVDELVVLLDDEVVGAMAGDEEDEDEEDEDEESEED
jgi:hypothetical protein